jgi:CubicO group peptidase (beta-lactamase class C family)
MPAASTLVRDGYPWPEAAPASVGVDPAALDAGLAWVETRPFVHGVLVVRDGALVAERYSNDFRGTDPQCIKSVSKSILSALFGIAYRRGEVTPETLVADVLPEYFEGQEVGKRAITVADLLTMSAGLAWKENTPEYMQPFVAADDWAAFVLAQPLVAEPGTVFEYSSGLTHVGARVLERVSGQRISEYAAEHLFTPLGIEPQRWDVDTQDRDVGGWEVWMPPRDLARFGQLYLDGGQVGGVEIVPPDWIAGTTIPLVASDYGGWWWVRDTLGHPTYYAWGWGGQFIFVIEDLDLVVVVTSEWWDETSLDAAYEQAFTLLDDYIVPASLP